LVVWVGKDFAHKDFATDMGEALMVHLLLLFCSSQVSNLVGIKFNKAGDMHSWMVVVVVVVMVVPNPSSQELEL
jgi:hypothetical protein